MRFIACWLDGVAAERAGWEEQLEEKSLLG